MDTIFITLAQHNVEYLLVGGMGAVAHGACLQTSDIDICPAIYPENLERIAAVLRTLSATLIRMPARGLKNIDFAVWPTLRLDDPREHHLFATPYGTIDVLPEPFGAQGWGNPTNYRELQARAVLIEAFGVAIQVAALADIMAAKAALGRPQDIAAAAALEQLAQLLAKGAAPTCGLEQLAQMRGTTKPTFMPKEGKSYEDTNPAAGRG